MSFRVVHKDAETFRGECNGRIVVAIAQSDTTEITPYWRPEDWGKCDKCDLHATDSDIRCEDCQKLMDKGFSACLEALGRVKK